MLTALERGLASTKIQIRHRWRLTVALCAISREDRSDVLAERNVPRRLRPTRGARQQRYREPSSKSH
jgi:hypothetical protein